VPKKPPEDDRDLRIIREIEAEIDIAKWHLESARQRVALRQELLDALTEELRIESARLIAKQESMG
jgi:hypothetical protein